MATITNQAALSYNGITTLSNIAVGELVETLTATKTASIGAYTAGITLTYVVTLNNSGTVPFTGLRLTDNLGGYTFGAATVYPLRYVTGSLLYYTNGTLQAAPAVTEGPPLAITGLAVPAGGSAVLVYQASLTAVAPPEVNDSILNRVTITEGGLTAPVAAEETVTAAAKPVLAISKSLSPATVTENGTLTYTLTVQNSGNTAAVAADNIIIRDTFDPLLRNVAVTFNGATWTANNQYTYNGLTGEFAATPGAVTVPAATFVQDPNTGVYTVIPGVSTLVITGTV